jgi:Holliday junction resolvase
MVRSYAKGYAAERQLIHLLASMGYMTIRAPRSGSISLASPDVIAAKHGKLVVIECKSRKGAFSVPREQLDELKAWREKAGAQAYVGWKISRQGWTFLHLDDVYMNNGNVGKKFAQEKGISIEAI